MPLALAPETPSVTLASAIASLIPRPHACGPGYRVRDYATCTGLPRYSVDVHVGGRGWGGGPGVVVSEHPVGSVRTLRS